MQFPWHICDCLDPICRSSHVNTIHHVILTMSYVETSLQTSFATPALFRISQFFAANASATMSSASAAKRAGQRSWKELLANADVTQVTTGCLFAVLAGWTGWVDDVINESHFQLHLIIGSVLGIRQRLMS